jgi:hypothetical protein
VEGIGEPRVYEAPVTEAEVKADLIQKYLRAMASGDSEEIAALRRRASQLGFLDDLPDPPG